MGNRLTPRETGLLQSLLTIGKTAFLWYMECESIYSQREVTIRCIPLAFEIDLREGVAFDVGSLFDHLTTLHDQRDARGLRYALVTVLVFVILAKLAGENHLRGIAEWVAHRKELLAEGLGLVKPQAPHPTIGARDPG